MKLQQNELIILMPTRGFVLTEVITALEEETARLRLVPITLRTFDLPLPISRNFLIETALKLKDWKYALLVDDDVILPKGGIQELLNLNADIAVMDYPLHGKVDGKTPGTIVRDKDKSIAFAGLGATLVKREVFEKMPQPWFVLTQYRTNRSKDGYIGFFASQRDGNPQISAGEDTHFYLNARKLNFKIKESKLIATHCRIEQVIPHLHTARYQSQHKIVKVNKVERELL